jgi:release factor glutamine methyltransferase
MVEEAPSIRNILQKSIQFLQKKEVPEAKLSAEWLMAEALGYKRLDLYLRQDEIIPPATLAKLRGWIKRRSEREPWQYIVGHAAFMDLDLKVDARVLIPRPETEELVVHLIESLKPINPKHLLDLGTGSGAILLSLLKAFPNAEGVGVDQSADALCVAKENATRLGLDGRTQWVQSNWLDGVEGLFDAIAANPPYLNAQEVLDAEPEVKDHEPYNALMAPDEGAADLKHILDHARHHLHPSGTLILEMGIHHGPLLKAHAEALGYKRVAILKDLSKRDRFLMAYV